MSIKVNRIVVYWINDYSINLLCITTTELGKNLFNERFKLKTYPLKRFRDDVTIINSAVITSYQLLSEDVEDLVDIFIMIDAMVWSVIQNPIFSWRHRELILDSRKLSVQLILEKAKSKGRDFWNSSSRKQHLVLFKQQILHSSNRKLGILLSAVAKTKRRPSLKRRVINARILPKSQIMHEVMILFFN